MDSLQIRLSVAACAVIVGFASLAGVWSFAAAFDDATEIQDNGLAAVSKLFGNCGLPLPTQPLRTPHIDRDSRIVVEPVGAEGQWFFQLPADAPDGYQTVSVNDQSWRILVRTTTKSHLRIAVGERTAARDHIAWDAGGWTAIPLLLLVPVLCGLIFLLVHRMLSPIAALSRSLDRRSESDLGHVQATGLPSEIRPIVAAINSLLSRVGRSMTAQRGFIADAAHELRLPLAALSVQAENVGESSGGEETAARLVPLRQGIERARLLLEQLLALARAQAPSDAVAGSCCARTVLYRVVEQLLPLAESKKVDLEVTQLALVAVAASELDLTLILRNLIDNAIRYSNSGSPIQIAISPSDRDVRIEICDHGHGIPNSERQRVFEPFYRIAGGEEAGVGLGLAIVLAVVQRLRGEIVLGWTTDQPPQGLRVSVTLPSALPWE